MAHPSRLFPALVPLALGSLLALVRSAFAADALPYATEPAFGDLKFNQPLAIVSPPKDPGRLFILE